MPAWGKASLEKWAFAHPELKILFDEVIKHFDCTLITSFRGEQEQNEAYEKGASKLKWPYGKHNSMPSLAVDVAPFHAVKKIDWDDIHRFIYFGGYVMGIAKQLLEAGKIKHKIIWGGDWNRDTHLKDNRFNDLVHFELVI